MTQTDRVVIRPETMALYFAAKIFPGVLTMISVPIWIRLVGVEAYGKYALGWAIAISASSFGVGWIRQSALRFMGSRHGSLRHFPKVAVLGSIFAAALACAAAYGLIAQGTLGVDVVVAIFGASIAVATLVTTVLQRDARSGTYNGLETFKVVATLALGILLAKQGIRGEESIFAAATVANLCGVWTLTPWRRISSPATPDGDPSNLWLWWRYGWPMSLWLGLSPLLLYADRIVLGVVANPTVVGTYAATSDLMVRGVAMLGFPVSMALHPVVMRAVNQGHREEALGVARRWTKLLFAGLTVVTVLAVSVGPAPVGWLLGTEPPSRAVVGLLLLGAGLWQVAQLAHKTLEVENRTVWMLVALVLALLLEIGVSCALVDVAGPKGVAVGLVVGAVSYLLIVMLLSRRRMEQHV